MISKTGERQKAISLRRQGFSYREILKEVPVAKSTLSLWLRSVGLSEKQKQHLTEKKRLAALRGAKKRHDERIQKSLGIRKKAKKEIGLLSERELWLMGIMLHWAEGAKEKDWHPSVGVRFSNSDANMLKFFLNWLEKFCNISLSDIKIEIYLHKNSRNDLETVRKYWSQQLDISSDFLHTVYWKKNNIMTNRHNRQQNYYGILVLVVKKSTNLNRKISGWIEGIYQKSTI